jgi:hypothetical protein
MSTSRDDENILAIAGFAVSRAKSALWIGRAGGTLRARQCYGVTPR